MIHVIVPEKDWKNYGALLKSDDPEQGWDILANRRPSREVHLLGRTRR